MGGSNERNLSKVARGRWGEELVVRWYRSNGFAIVERNWRCELGELDVIARRCDLLVVCEVKARHSDRYGPAAAAVTFDKQQRIRRLTARWLRDAGLSGVTVRFDVAAVTGVELHVIPAAF